MRRWVWIAALALAGCRKPGPPYSPAQAAQMFRLEAGWNIELFASEPHVVSPVAMEIDEEGRIYVVENRGYPLDASGVSRIKLLEDRDGDGRVDRARVWAEGLVMPTGIMRWKRGLLVSDAPHLWYLEDTDGDGDADLRRVVLTGFAFTNPQHTVNSPIYGLDNWIYLAHESPTTAIIFKDQFGDRGSDIRFQDRPQVRIAARGRNIRFRPDAYQLEALSGTSQFGHAFDEWGRHFTLNNSNHARHEVVAAQYLARNPDLPVANAMQDISDHGAAAKVFPIAAQPRVEMLTNVGEFTSACGLTYWQGSLLVAEPAHNLVHRDLLRPAGATFVARREREDVEFLASTDPWFRPVNFYLGPDGGVYLLDYYRLVVEHPEWMSAEHHHQDAPALKQGIDRGRIWRLNPGRRVERWPGQMSDAELAGRLGDVNPWWRRTAQRLLVERRSGAVQTEDPSAVGRVHRLWTLEGVGRLEERHVAAALRDPEAGVRENAVRLSERWPRLLAGLTDDADARVRFQLTLSHPDAAVRERLLFANLEDKWFQIAALTSVKDPERLMARAAGPESAGRTLLLRNLAALVREPEPVLAALAGRPAWHGAAVLEGLRLRRPASRRTQELLLAMFSRPALRLLETAGLPPGFDARPWVRLAIDRRRDAERRADAIGLLALAGPEKHAGALRQLMAPEEPEPVQAAAVRALGRIPGEEIAAYLLKNWRHMTGAARAEAADAMYTQPERVKMLLAALQEGEVQAWTLAFRHKRRLIMHPDPAVRDAARPLLEATPADRQALVTRYAAALEGPADPARGRRVFKDACAKCHAFRGEGAQVGPDLATVRHQSKHVLLTEILMPSRAISQGYESYVVETVNGTLDGVLGPQTPETLTLRHEDGKEDMIRRSDIKGMYVTQLSAMPADLEKQVDPQAMADLLEYLKSGG